MITPGSQPALWRGIAEWTVSDGLWWPSRIPRRELAMCAVPRLTDRPGCRQVAGLPPPRPRSPSRSAPGEKALEL